MGEISENGEMLMFLPNFYKNQKLCNKAVNTFSSEIWFAPECNKTQEMRDKSVDTYPYVFNSVLD